MQAGGDPAGGGRQPHDIMYAQLEGLAHVRGAMWRVRLRRPHQSAPKCTYQTNRPSRQDNAFGLAPVSDGRSCIVREQRSRTGFVCVCLSFVCKSRRAAGPVRKQPCSRTVCLCLFVKPDLTNSRGNNSGHCNSALSSPQRCRDHWDGRDTSLHQHRIAAVMMAAVDQRRWAGRCGCT